MARNKTRINKPVVNQYFTRIDARVPEDSLNMDVLLIAPVTRDYALYTEDGVLNTEAQVSDRTLSVHPYAGPTGTARGGVETISFPFDPTRTESTIEHSVNIYSTSTSGVPRKISNSEGESFCVDIDKTDLTLVDNGFGAALVISGDVPNEVEKLKKASERGYLFSIDGIRGRFYHVGGQPMIWTFGGLLSDRWSSLGSTITINKTKKNWYVQEDTASYVYAGVDVAGAKLELPNVLGEVDLTALQNVFDGSGNTLGLGSVATLELKDEQNEVRIEVDDDANEILLNFVSSTEPSVDEWLELVYIMWDTNPQAFDDVAKGFFRAHNIRSAQDLIDLTDTGEVLDGITAADFVLDPAAPTTITFGGVEPSFLFDLGANYLQAETVTFEPDTDVDAGSALEDVITYHPEDRHLEIKVPTSGTSIPTSLTDAGIRFAGEFDSTATSYRILDIPVATLGYTEDLDDIFTGFSDQPAYKATAAEVFRIAAGDIVVPTLAQIDFTDLSALNSPRWATELYIERTTIRKEFTLDASLLVTGNRPGAVLVTKNTYKEILGEPTPTNPGALAAKTFFDTAGTYRCFVMSPTTVTEAEPFGDAQSILDVAAFVQGRDAYHLVSLNDSPGFAYKVRTYLEDLGGTETVPLKAEQRFYIPSAIPQNKAPSLISPAIVSSSGVTQGEWGADVIVQDLDAIAQITAWLGVELDKPLPSVDDTPDMYLHFRDMPGVGETSLVDGTVATRTKVTVSSYNEGLLELTLRTDADLPSIMRPTHVHLYSIEEAFSGSPIERIEQLCQETVRQSNQCTHPRLNRVYVGGATTVINGNSIPVEKGYVVASLGGIIASNPQWKPVTGKQFRNFTEISGTSDTFNEDQLERITGAGNMIPVQDVVGETPVYLFRDVSTDTSTVVFQRRSAGVTEDMLARSIRNVVRPMLGAELLTDTYLDMVSAVLGGVEDRHKEQFYSLEFGEVSVITEADRKKYVFGDTGVKVEVAYTHLEEAGSAIVEHVVTG